MINLLPDEVKHNIAFARRNTKLRRWMAVFMLSIVGIIVITVLGLFYMQQNINNLSAKNEQIQQDLNNQQLDKVQKQVTDMTNSLKLVVQVLSREILFSKLIGQIAVAIPNNAVLTDLDISKTQGGIDLSAAAVDYNTATQVQVNLQDPANKIFDKADILNISCNKTSSAVSKRYPCAVTIRAQFAKTNPFQFIGGTKAQ